MISFLSPIVVSLLIIVVFMNEYFQQRLKVSTMPSMDNVGHEMICQIPRDNKGTIVELGSGWGGVAVKASQNFPDNEVIGYELSIFPFMVSKIKQLFLRRNLNFIRKNFFSVDLNNASVVLCYLSNDIMHNLKDKFLKELPSGALIISSTFFIDGWEEEKIVTVKGIWNTQIFVYRKK